jgi:uncharacterized membrane protein YbhN (UPF0104 family)
LKSNRNRIVAALIVLAVVALVWFERHRIHFDWHAFGQQLHMADWRRIVFGLGCIYAAYLVRSVRWAWLVRHKKKLSPLSLLGTLSSAALPIWFVRISSRKKPACRSARKLLCTLWSAFSTPVRWR